MLQEFSSLEALVEFDFHQMRSLDNSRASDEALQQFHNLLHRFFNQFPTVPDLPILQTYLMYMSKITEKNQCS